MKRLFSVFVLCVLAAFFLVGCGSNEETGSEKKTPIIQKPLKGKRIVMIIPEKDFRDEELIEPMDMLNEQGAAVTIASTTTEIVRGMQGEQIQPDMLVDQIKPEDWDAVVFIGGAGASQYWDDSTAHAIAKGTLDAGKILGAICIAPVTLANAGILQGKKATCWESEAGKLKAKGVEYTGANVERDGKIITAKGPKAATAFGLELSVVLQE